MSDIDLTAWFLTALITYGPILLSFAVFLGALGLPLPGTLFLLATGAFVQQGSVNGVTAFWLALGGVVLGDSIGYWIGRSTMHLLPTHFTQRPNWLKAQARFAREGGTAVYFTRFLFTPFAVPTNLIAGSSGYAFGRFLRYDMVGECTWILLYGGLGYLAGAQWQAMSQSANYYSGLLMSVIVLTGLLYSLVRTRFNYNCPEVAAQVANSF